MFPKASRVLQGASGDFRRVPDSLSGFQWVLKGYQEIPGASDGSKEFHGVPGGTMKSQGRFMGSQELFKESLRFSGESQRRFRRSQGDSGDLRDFRVSYGHFRGFQAETYIVETKPCELRSATTGTPKTGALSTTSKRITSSVLLVAFFDVTTDCTSFSH